MLNDKGSRDSGHTFRILMKSVTFYRRIFATFCNHKISRKGNELAYECFISIRIK